MGQQFTYIEFRLGMIILVFAMALSFLGVWEIPIPGFVGGNTTQKLQRKEGSSGAFFKGIFTTLWPHLAADRYSAQSSDSCSIKRAIWW